MDLNNQKMNHPPSLDRYKHKTTPIIQLLYYLFRVGNNFNGMINENNVLFHGNKLPHTRKIQIITCLGHTSSLVKGQHGTRQQHATWDLEAHAPYKVLQISCVRMEGWLVQSTRMTQLHATACRNFPTEHKIIVLWVEIYFHTHLERLE